MSVSSDDPIARRQRRIEEAEVRCTQKSVLVDGERNVVLHGAGGNRHGRDEDHQHSTAQAGAPRQPPPSVRHGPTETLVLKIWSNQVTFSLTIRSRSTKLPVVIGAVTLTDCVIDEPVGTSAGK